MNECKLKLEELSNPSGEPEVALVLNRGGDELVRRVVRVFSEDDIIAASNDMAAAGTVRQALARRNGARESAPRSPRRTTRSSACYGALRTWAATLAS